MKGMTKASPAGIKMLWTESLGTTEYENRSIGMLTTLQKPGFHPYIYPRVA